MARRHRPRSPGLVSLLSLKDLIPLPHSPRGHEPLGHVRIGARERFGDIGALPCEYEQRSVMRVCEGPGQEQLVPVVGRPGQPEVFLTQCDASLEVGVESS